ncbi:MAG TPA: cation:proton antiporter [Nitrososphaerales archaeon]|nr:cation:proton antiporter [Nitrososphaerales archaeon]
MIVVEFFLAVFIMLLVARVFGEVLQRVKQPTLGGELLAGVLIGPSILNVVQPTANLTLVANISLFFIMFLTGLRLHTKDIVEAGRKAMVVSVLAFAVPFAVGAYVSSLFGLTLVESLVVGLTLAITAVPVNSIILMEFGMLKTKLGATVITAGVINDIMSLVVLGVILQLPAGGSPAVNYVGVAASVGKIALFVGGILFVDRLLRRNPEWVQSQLARLGPRLGTKESSFGLMLTFSIGVSELAEWAGLHFVIGTFFAGLLLNEIMGDDLLGRDTTVLSGITFGFFAPLLFAFIGVEFNAEAIAGVLALAGALLLVAISGKLFGGYVGARLAGFSRSQSNLIAFMLNSRGFVELVIATIAYQAGLIDLALFSIVVAIGVITTIMSPITARFAISRQLKNPERREEAPEASERAIAPPVA